MKLFLLFLFVVSLFGADIRLPFASFATSAGVRDVVAFENKLYVATEASCVDIFDIQSKERISKIEVAKIKDFMGDTIDAKIYSVDVIKDKILVLAQGEAGFTQLFIHQNGKTQLVIPSSDMLSIAKAKFIDENSILLGLLSNELILYDTKTQEQKYQVPISGSKFSSFALNEKRDEVVVADESGILKVLRVSDAKLLQTLKGQNLDNVFQVQVANAIVVSAGQDRRVVVYNTKKNAAYYKTSGFLIYTVGVSPSAAFVAYSSDEHNNITVFERETQKELARFGGIKMTPTNILFLNENEFLVSSDDKIINLYKIK